MTLQAENGLSVGARLFLFAQTLWLSGIQSEKIPFGKMLTQDIFEAQRAAVIGRYLENFPTDGIFLTEN